MGSVTHDGAMVALIPTDAEAERLAVDGGEPAGELHVTLAYLGKADDWSDDDRDAVRDAIRSAVEGRGVPDAEVFALSIFNPGDVNDRDTCVVLGLSGPDLADLHQAVADALSDTDGLPEQHRPWVPHLTLTYTDDIAEVLGLTDRVGPVTFDRVRVAFAGEHTDIPLGHTAATDMEVRPVTADGPDLDLTDAEHAVYDRMRARASVAARRFHNEQPRRRTARAKATDARPWYRIENAADTGAATIYIYGVIGWDVEASAFVEELNAIDADSIDVHINSPGGSVFDGVAIYQALRNHKATITTYVDALAASAASYIAMAGDRRVAAPYATLMIHEASGLCWGNAADMTAMAGVLDKLSATIASIYATRTGTDIADWRQAMRDESWYTAAEAVEAGLMQQVQADEDKTPDTDATNAWDLSAFAYAGREQAPAPRIPQPTDAAGPTDPPAAEPDPITEPIEEDYVSTALSDAVRARLGLSDDADEAAVTAAVLAALEAKPTPDEPTPDPQPDPEPTPTDSVTAQYAEQIQRMSAELAEMKARDAAVAKATVLDNAVKAGKIRPADREEWSNRYDRAPEVTTDILNSFADNSAVPLATTGDVGDPEQAGIDAEYAALVARIDAPSVKGA